MATRVSKVTFEGEQATGVLAQCGDEPATRIRARVVVDASGRATVIGKQLGLRQEIPNLRKASIWSYFRGGQRLEGIDAGETTVFTIQDRGWFWYIPLPSDIVSVGIVASPEYLFDETNKFEEVFLREVNRCQPLPTAWTAIAKRRASG